MTKKTRLFMLLIALSAQTVFAQATASADSFSQGMNLFNQRQYENALPWFARAVQEHPEKVEPYYYLGYCQYMTGDQKNAAANFHQAEQRSPNPELRKFADRLLNEKFTIADRQGEAGATASGPITLPSPSAEPATNIRPAPEKLLTFSIGPLLSVPVSRFASEQFLVGVGAEISANYALNQNFSLGLALGYQHCPLNLDPFYSAFEETFGMPVPEEMHVSAGFTCVPILATAKYTICGGETRPYLLWGAGYSFNNVDERIEYHGDEFSATASENAFILAPGLGVAFYPSPYLEIFLQGRVDLIFTSNNDSVPFKLTVEHESETVYGSLTGDNPTFTVPIQAGLRFIR